MAESNTKPAMEKQGALCVAIDLPTNSCKNTIKENILNDQSWKKTHLTDPNRKPLYECPHCNWKAYSVVEAWGKAAHMWECHGVPGEFTMNRRTTRYGPDSADPAPEDTKLSEHLDSFNLSNLIQRITPSKITAIFFLGLGTLILVGNFTFAPIHILFAGGFIGFWFCAALVEGRY